MLSLKHMNLSHTSMTIMILFKKSTKYCEHNAVKKQKYCKKNNADIKGNFSAILIIIIIIIIP